MHELIVDHLLGILKDPLSDFAGVDSLALLSNPGRISSLLLIKLGSLLHSNHLLSLAFGLDVCLGFLAFDNVKFPLLLLDFALHISFLLRRLLLKLNFVVTLLFYFLHHCDLLRLHFINLRLHGFCL